MWGRKRESTRLELGSEHMPIGMIVAAVSILALVVFLIAYFNRTPYGAVVTPPREAELAFKEYLAKNEPRVPGEFTFYNCAGFMDSLFSGDQFLGAVFELRGMRAIAGQEPSAAVPNPDKGNVVFLAGKKQSAGDWTIVASRPAGLSYPLKPQAPVDQKHPCNLESGLKP